MTETSRIAYKTTLSSYPANAWAYFECLDQAGAGISCLYGGALRDTDCAAFQGRIIPVNDYDMRVWLPSSLFKENIAAVLHNLQTQNGAVVEDAQWWAPHKPRYKVTLFGGEIDFSFRAKPDAMFLNKNAMQERIAQDRAVASDLGLSAVALDHKGQAWVLEEYLRDRGNLTMTVFASDHTDRSIAYAQRLIDKKYPLHRIIQPQ